MLVLGITGASCYGVVCREPGRKRLLDTFLYDNFTNKMKKHPTKIESCNILGKRS